MYYVHISGAHPNKGYKNFEDAEAEARELGESAQNLGKVVRIYSGLCAYKVTQKLEMIEEEENERGQNV